MTGEELRDGGRAIPGALRAALLALLATAFAGCASLGTPSAASLPAPTVAPDWPARRAWLQRDAMFDLRGRVAVAAGEEGFSAGLRWNQRDAEARIELDGPFGVGGLRLLARGDALELTTARGERLDGDAARAELERRLGFALPLSALRYWVRGVPDPSTPAIESLAPDAPRLAALEQLGWHVEYAAYVDAPGSAVPLPRRLVVVRESARLRMVIESWAGEAGR